MKKLTLEEREFIIASQYPIWVTRINFEERFGRTVSWSTCRNLGGKLVRPRGVGRYDDGVAITTMEAGLRRSSPQLRKLALERQEEVNDWRKDHNV